MVELDPQFIAPGGDYASAWNDYRRRRRWYFSIACGGLAAIITLAMLFSGQSVQCLNFLVLAPIWAIAFSVAAIRLCRFICPRCGRPFCATRLVAHLYTRRCVHCGLPRWAKSDSLEDES
jgi:hypothetical protein